MNIELTDLEEILLYLETTSLEPHNDYTSEFTYKDQKILYKYIKELQQENDKLKEQQKEFIKYLENMLDDENDIFSVVRVKDALQKYKEIIGDDK
jgi:hypothetical protein